jgi:L-asparaginase
MPRVLILGTGGTIAGTGSDPDRPWAYQAAKLDVGQLVDSAPELVGVSLSLRQVSQIDSKDMVWPVWQALALALNEAVCDSAVKAVVITHGTDTFEETACLLHHLHDGNKPIVLTAAMRPATAADADGPRNLRDAVNVACEAALRGWGGVVAVLHGRVWSGRDVRKRHSHALDAFDGGGAAPLATLNAVGRMIASVPSFASAVPPSLSVAWPPGLAWGWDCVAEIQPPRVELLFSHADADGWMLDAALRQSAEDAASSDPSRRAQALRGLVLAATGHGTVHAGLDAALQRAASVGVRIWRSSRVARGGVTPRDGDAWPAAGTLTPAQARVALQLTLWREGLNGPR